LVVRSGHPTCLWPPRRSTDNAVVERCHAGLNAWVEPTRCTSLDHLAAELQAQALVQRSLYPACQGQPRLHAFPALLNRPRPYQALREAALWQLDPVLTYLARFTFSRKVEKNGRITLLSHELSIGRAFRAQTVTLRLDPATACWLVQDRDGVLLKSLLALPLDYPTIASLHLTFRHFKATRKAKLVDASPGRHPYSV